MICGERHDKRVGTVARYLFNYARSVYEKPDFSRLSLEQTAEKRLFAKFPKENVEFTRVIENFLRLISDDPMDPVGIKIIYARADAQELQVLLEREKKRFVLIVSSDGQHELAGYRDFASKEPLYDVLDLSDPMQVAFVKTALAKIHAEHELFKTALEAKDPKKALAAVGEIARRRNVDHLAALAMYCEDERVAMAAFDNFAAHRMLDAGNATNLDYTLMSIVLSARCETVKDAARRLFSEIKNPSRPPNI